MKDKRPEIQLPKKAMESIMELISNIRDKDKDVIFLSDDADGLTTEDSIREIYTNDCLIVFNCIRKLRQEDEYTIIIHIGNRPPIIQNIAIKITNK
jgi:hypothetical protein